MQVLIVLSNPDPEIKWNALRFANVLLNAGEEVTVFLNRPASDVHAGDSPQFPIREKVKLFGLSEGQLHA